MRRPPPSRSSSRPVAASAPSSPAPAPGARSVAWVAVSKRRCRAYRSCSPTRSARPRRLGRDRPARARRVLRGRGHWRQRGRRTNLHRAVIDAAERVTDEESFAVGAAADPRGGPARRRIGRDQRRCGAAGRRTRGRRRPCGHAAARRLGPLSDEAVDARLGGRVIAPRIASSDVSSESRSAVGTATRTRAERWRVELSGGRSSIRPVAQRQHAAQGHRRGHRQGAEQHEDR
jgi:hypothetical protein